jgi:hypothetical protein
MLAEMDAHKAVVSWNAAGLGGSACVLCQHQPSAAGGATVMLLLMNSVWLTEQLSTLPSTQLGGCWPLAVPADADAAVAATDSVLTAL